MGCPIVVLCGISSRFQLLFPWYGQIAHALLTRPPLTKQPKSFGSFDLHVLSMPPAFILSQNQTLKFNCLKSLLAISSNGSNFLLSLCWLAQRLLKFFLKYFEKLTEITFHLLVCQIKSHFFLIPFLIFVYRTSVRANRFLADSLYILPQTYLWCQAFFRTFFNFFKIIFRVLFACSFRVSPRGQLVHNTISKKACQTFFTDFLNFF